MVQNLLVFVNVFLVLAKFVLFRHQGRSEERRGDIPPTNFRVDSFWQIQSFSPIVDIRWRSYQNEGIVDLFFFSFIYLLILLEWKMFTLSEYFLASFRLFNRHMFNKTSVAKCAHRWVFFLFFAWKILIPNLHFFLASFRPSSRLFHFGHQSAKYESCWFFSFACIKDFFAKSAFSTYFHSQVDRARDVFVLRKNSSTRIFFKSKNI